MNYNHFHIANKIGRYAFVFCVWAICMSILFLVRVGQLCIESGRLFRTQFDQGYSGLDGSFCPLTCGISCELPILTSDTFELEQSEEVIEVPIPVTELGEWWLSKGGNPYTRISDLKRGYRKAVKRIAA